MVEVHEHYNNKWYQRIVEIESKVLYGVSAEEKYDRETGLVLDKCGLDLQHGDKVLDIACGTGEHARRIAEKTGASVKSIDKADILIEQAREIEAIRRGTRREIGEITGVVDYVVGDMEKIKEAVDPGEKFKAITCMGSSFMYLGSHKAHIQALKDFYDLLEPGGKLIFQWRNDFRWKDETGELSEEEKKRRYEKAKWLREMNGAIDLGTLTLKDLKEGDGFRFTEGSKPRQRLDPPPYSDINIDVYEGSFGRIYIDPDGVEYPLGETEYIDYVKRDAFPVLKRMLEEAHFRNIELMPRDGKGEPLSQDGSVRIFAVTAQK